MANELITRLFKRDYYNAVKQFSQEAQSGFIERGLDVFLDKINSPNGTNVEPLQSNVQNSFSKSVPEKGTFAFEEYIYSYRKEIQSFANTLQEGERIKQQYISACVHFLQTGVPLSYDKARYLVDNEDAIRITAEFLEKQKIEIGDYWNIAKKGLKLTPYEIISEPYIIDRKELIRRIDYIVSHEDALCSCKHLRLYLGIKKPQFDILVGVLEDDTLSKDYANFVSLFRTAFEQYPKTMRSIYESKSFNTLRDSYSLETLLDAVKVNELYLSKERKKSLIAVICDGIVPEDNDLSHEAIQLKNRFLQYAEHAIVEDADLQEYSCSIVYTDRNSFLTELLGSDNIKIRTHVPLTQCYYLAQELSLNDTSYDAVLNVVMQNKEAVKEYNRLKTGKKQLLLSNLEQVAKNSPDLTGFIEKWLIIDNILALREKYPDSYSRIIGDHDRDSLLTLSKAELNQKLQLEDKMEEEAQQLKEHAKLLKKCKTLKKQYPEGFDYFTSINGITSIDSATIEQLQHIYDSRENIHLIEVKQKAKSILNNYPDAARERYGAGITALRSISTIEKANAVIESESELKERQEQIIHNRDIGNRLKNAVRDWGEVKGIPYYHFFWYYPVRFQDVSQMSRAVRSLVYNFKDGVRCDEVVALLEKKLKDTFETEDLRQMTFVCIPASTVAVNKERYEDFSYRLCNRLGMRDAFDHIYIVKEKTAAHLGGEDEAVFSFDEEFFRGQRVILFDDIVTRGGSMLKFKTKMTELGASVVCALSIGRTYSDWNGHEPEPHPWTGEF